MANTKNLSRPDRKQARRSARKELKKLYHALSRKERNTLKKEKQGLKQFVAKKRAEAEAAKQDSASE